MTKTIAVRVINQSDLKIEIAKVEVATPKDGNQKIWIYLDAPNKARHKPKKKKQ